MPIYGHKCWKKARKLTSRLDYIRASCGSPMPEIIFKMSATLVFGYHFDIAKKRILTQNEIDRYMNNSDDLREDGLEYSDDVDFLPDCVSSNEDSDSDCENSVSSQNAIQNTVQSR
ncbi:hypothetical protein TNCV_4496521 [Trichonephila clavipes]|nr:hypothetical protein TNCV_4496521 [Trichonephila clavipes]